MSFVHYDFIQDQISGFNVRPSNYLDLDQQDREDLECEMEYGYEYDWDDYWEDYIQNGDARELLLRRMPNTQDVVELEGDRAARGKCTCFCGKQNCQISACSDVGGVYIYCDNCGLIDL